MATDEKNARYVKFLIYMVVIVLINIVGLTLFFRLDLTRNQIYSISNLSQDVVGNLAEPMTIEIFFTKDLGAPYNTIEQSLRDLLEEYAVYSNKNFNFRFYDVSPDEGDISEEAKTNRDLAQSYGIHPVQIQVIEADQVKVQRAYMGLVMIHGDLIEKIPFIEGTEGLEYKLTTMIQKMHNKTGALVNLTEKIKVKLFLSSSLEIVAPYVRLTGLAEIPQKVQDVVKKLNGKNFGKLDYSFIDPSQNPEILSSSAQYNLLNLRWPVIQDINGRNIPEGEGTVGLVMEYGEKAIDIPILSVTRIPILGTRYELTDMDTLEEAINENVESLININDDLGYLTDHGTLPLQNPGMLPGQPQAQNPEQISEFNTLVSETYSLKMVNLTDGDIPDGLQCLVIARPKDEFSDYQLYQIDQYLMQGKSIAFFLDGFNEIRPGGQQAMQFNQGPMYIPLNTGLEKLLSHYGVSMKKSYIMDKNCFTQRMRTQTGVEEFPIYFAPRIKSKNINHEAPYLKNINDLLALNLSPLELDEDRLREQGLTATLLFSSSAESWEMSGRINLNPMFIQPPQESEYKANVPLAYLIQGEFSSYFADKQIPEKPAATGENGEPAVTGAGEERTDLASIEGGGKISKGKPGKILIIGSSTVLRNDVINWQVEGENREREFPNRVFLMNLLDVLNGREPLAEMRSKRQSFNPLEETSAGTRNFIKTFNIAGLTVLVILVGLLIWLRRNASKKRIQLIFQK